MKETEKEFFLLRRELLEVQRYQKIPYYAWLLYLHKIKIPFTDYYLYIPFHLIIFLIVYKFFSLYIVNISGISEEDLIGKLLGFILNYLLFYIIYVRLSKMTKEKKEQSLIAYFYYYYPIVKRKIFDFLGLE
jgi:hypothetical protein